MTMVLALRLPDPGWATRVMAVYLPSEAAAGAAAVASVASPLACCARSLAAGCLGCARATLGRQADRLDGRGVVRHLVALPFLVVRDACDGLGELVRRASPRARQERRRPDGIVLGGVPDEVDAPADLAEGAGDEALQRSACSQPLHGIAGRDGHEGMLPAGDQLTPAVGGLVAHAENASRLAPMRLQRASWEMSA